MESVIDTTLDVEFIPKTCRCDRLESDQFSLIFNEPAIRIFNQFKSSTT
jgi:hypothetical protein